MHGPLRSGYVWLPTWQHKHLFHAEHGLPSASSFYISLLGLEAASSSSTRSFQAMPSLAFRESQRPHPTSLISRPSPYQASLLHVSAAPSVLYGITVRCSMALLH